MRKDGRFVGLDGSVPEGQGIIMAHLNECHELVEMVRHLPCFARLNLILVVVEGVHGRRGDRGRRL